MKLKSLNLNKKSSGEFDRQWILRNALKEIENYEKGVLTIRGLHYRLVSRGMTNDLNHYRRVSTAMTYARWEGIVDFDTFSDNDRAMIGKTKWEETTVEDKVDTSKFYIEYYMNNYYKNRWENQPIYPEVFIEKKALQGVFEPVCKDMDVALGACKGYPSLTFLDQTAKRMYEAYIQGKIPYILYFGDYDPTGEDIPRAIEKNMMRLGCTSLKLKRILLKKEQVLEWGLSPAPIKEGDSRSADWDGLGQVELDAIEPDVLQSICRKELDKIFDKSLYLDLIKRQKIEKVEYKKQLKEYIDTL